MPDLFSKISEILSNPESAQKIREIASTLSPTAQTGDASPDAFAEPVSGETEDLPAASPVDSLSLLSGLSSGGGSHSRDLMLLQAMRPYLRSSRAGKIDNAIKAIRVIDMLSALR